MTSKPKVLHQNKRDGQYYETLCGLNLDPDTRTRNDVILATLLVSPQDVLLNFGENTVKCPQCVLKGGGTELQLQEECSRIANAGQDWAADADDWAQV
jgi:hypothetical protein